LRHRGYAQRDTSDSLNSLDELRPIEWRVVWLRPILNHAGDFSAFDGKERNCSRVHCAICDGYVRNGLIPGCYDAIYREGPRTFRWVRSVESSEILGTSKSLLRLRPIKDEIVREHRPDGVKVVCGHKSPKLVNHISCGHRIDSHNTEFVSEVELWRLLTIINAMSSDRFWPIW